jgi:hypothetical protein
MMWALVIVALIDGHGPESFLEGVYPTMDSCFVAREDVIYEVLGGEEGQPPINTQALCIRTDKY